MEIKSRKLVLSFGTPIKTSVDLTVNNPDATLRPTDIKAAMDQIVASGAIGDEAVADSIEGAKYVIQQIDEVSFE